MAYSKVQEERDELKKELLSKKEPELGILENYQSIHIDRTEKAFYSFKWVPYSDSQRANMDEQEADDLLDAQSSSDERMLSHLLGKDEGHGWKILSPWKMGLEYLEWSI